IGTFSEMNAVWDAWVDKSNPPARATVEARLAAPKYLVEIVVIAAVLTMLLIFSLAFIPAQVAAPATPETTLRGGMYVLSHPAGSYNQEPYLRGLKPSTIEPVDGVKYLGLKNAYFIRYKNVPALPFEDYYAPFKSLDRVVWSLTGEAGVTSAEERGAVFK